MFAVYPLTCLRVVLRGTRCASINVYFGVSFIHAFMHVKCYRCPSSTFAWGGNWQFFFHFCGAVLAVTVCQLARTVMDASWPTWRVYKVVGARTGFVQALW